MVLTARFFLYSILFAILFSSCRASRSNRKNEETTNVSSSGKVFATEYSRKLGVPVPETANQKLITQVYDWVGVPYKYGGNDKNGVDCSGLISNIFPLVYNLKVPRVSAQLYKAAVPVEKRQLREGDLVFFKINTAEVGHAGILLFEDYFVHASTSKGVMISRLGETYWSKYFVGGGRFSH
jgi:murein DD-endopeptidase / murein LD-carboxypeptidase